MSKKFWRVFDVVMLCAFLPFLIGVTLYLNGLDLLTPFGLCLYMVVISLYSMCVGTKIYGLILLIKQENNFKKATDEFNKAMVELDKMIEKKDVEELKKNLFEE